MPTKKPQVSVALSPDKLERLKDMARKEDVSVGHLLRRGADLVLKRHKKTAA